MKWTLYTFLQALDASKIHYRLERHREDTVMITIDVPGEKWEVEFFANGEVEIEIFRSDGSMQNESALAKILEKHRS